MNNLPILNRSVVTVVPQQAFFDWANRVFPDDPVNSTDFYEHNSYLIEEDLMFADKKADLKKYWKPIFEQELYGICTDLSTFPKMTWELFTQYFYCYCSSLVQDLTKKPLYLETYA
jgi:hypothetical protein